MGIDNGALLIYGWIFKWEEFSEKLKKRYSKDEFDYFIYDKFDLFFGSTSPYFDSIDEDRVYYLSFIDPQLPNKSELMRLFNKPLNPELAEFVFDIFSQSPHPELYCLPHIR